MSKETGENTAGGTARDGAGVADVSTGLAHERTDLAFERNYLASERTLMGWIRTTLSMISFGFTLGKVGQAMTDVEVKGVFRAPRMVAVDTIAYFLVIVGTLALLGATVQHILRARTYKKRGYRCGRSIAVWVAILLVVVGAFAMTALVVKL